ncbi:MBOAT family O-acyltransferase [Achromobacter aloeverae]|uniref:Probable alginate O-acetylase AlgI n=1 Tax=Achromobacter aloeverae TaxID=1750518 RepID=A0A4Q1HIR1_9BURK|nr:MBOAT family O-acyltransferase [Achromobacter aloeverae]RXN87957.1 membrane-bound O-acyltransferase family protein [Achromobacter aloeverae]
MGLISIEFGLGFPAFFLLYWLFRPRPDIQNGLLTVASLALLWHYASGRVVASVVVFTVLVYLVAKAMQASDSARGRKAWLFAGVTLAVLNLLFWKYAEPWRVPLGELLAGHGLDIDLRNQWLLPLGLSYYTFQGISYLVDCQRGDIQLGRRLALLELLGHFGLFLTVTAGPIQRVTDAKGLTDYRNAPCNALDQIKAREPRHIIAPTFALCLILAGLAKKWWLSGWLASHVVTPVFANPSEYHALDIFTAIQGYTLQLFFDFSGYSDLVVGMGLLLGLRLPVNFRAPLLAHNLREFWNRWHISLSMWIRDYLYIPLGGNRGGFARTQLNLLAAMVLSGIWHGWSGYFLKFALWGLLHGLGLVLLNIGDNVFARLPGWRANGRKRDFIAGLGLPARVLSTFLTVQFVCFCFILFPIQDLGEVVPLFHALGHNVHDVRIGPWTLPVLLAMLVLWALYPAGRRLPEHCAGALARLPALLRPALIFAGFVLIVLLAPSGIPGFMYANF